MNHQNTTKQVVDQLQAFEQGLPSDIQQQLNRRRQLILEKKASRKPAAALGFAVSCALVIGWVHFGEREWEPAPNKIEAVASVTLQPELFEEDIQMLAQLEFAYWLSEQEIDEAG